MALALSLSACHQSGSHSGHSENSNSREIGFLSSLPVLWGEEADISGYLASDRPQHWAVDVLREFGALHPLDTLSGGTGRAVPLGAQAILVMAQPYPLSPEENVALDAWVRQGGRVLLFADPMLTQHSAFAPGDRRRPQDMILLSPILSRWGLQLQFDDGQPAGRHLVDVGGMALPVDLPGAFALSNGEGDCRLEAAGLVATCRVGKGVVVAVADAALLDSHAASAADSGVAALRNLLNRFRR